MPSSPIMVVSLWWYSMVNKKNTNNLLENLKRYYTTGEHKEATSTSNALIGGGFLYYLDKDNIAELGGDNRWCCWWCQFLDNLVLHYLLVVLHYCSLINLHKFRFCISIKNKKYCKLLISKGSSVRDIVKNFKKLSLQKFSCW